MDLSKNHYLYNPNSNNLSFYEHPDKWSITGKAASTYLKEHVIRSLESDIPPILDIFDKDGSHYGKGFFAMIRIILPYLSWAGKLFSNQGNEAERAYIFLKRYCGEKYAEHGKMVYEIYRHGLMHCHFPFLIIGSDKSTVYTWKITTASSEHLKAIKEPFQCRDTGKILFSQYIPICPRELYQDVLSALNKFAQSLEDGEGVENFCNGFRSK